MRKTIGLAFVLVLAGVVILWRAASRSTDDDASPVTAPASAGAPIAGAPTPALPASAPGAIDEDEEPDELPTDGESAYPVDLEAMRRRMPENRYWTLDAPTTDAAVLRMREERKKADNALLGKILLTTATEQEIDEYYAERQRVSEDYMKFAAQVLADHRDQLPERDIGLYELTIRLHRGRLDQNPGRQGRGARAPARQAAPLIRRGGAPDQGLPIRRSAGRRAGPRAGAGSRSGCRSSG